MKDSAGWGDTWRFFRDDVSTSSLDAVLPAHRFDHSLYIMSSFPANAFVRSICVENINGRTLRSSTRTLSLSCAFVYVTTASFRNVLRNEADRVGRLIRSITADRIRFQQGAVLFFVFRSSLFASIAAPL